MSVLETVKQAIGLDSDHPLYRCQECGSEFPSEADPDSVWFSCPECSSDEAERLTE